MPHFIGTYQHAFTQSMYMYIKGNIMHKYISIFNPVLFGSFWTIVHNHDINNKATRGARDLPPTCSEANTASPLYPRPLIEPIGSHIWSMISQFTLRLDRKWNLQLLITLFKNYIHVKTLNSAHITWYKEICITRFIIVCCKLQNYMNHIYVLKVAHYLIKNTPSSLI